MHKKLCNICVIEMLKYPRLWWLRPQYARCSSYSHNLVPVSDNTSHLKWLYTSILPSPQVFSSLYKLRLLEPLACVWQNNINCGWNLQNEDLHCNTAPQSPSDLMTYYMNRGEGGVPVLFFPKKYLFPYLHVHVSIIK